MTKDKRGGNKEGLGLYELTTLPKWKLEIICIILNMPDRFHNKVIHKIVEIILLPFVKLLKYYLEH